MDSFYIKHTLAASTSWGVFISASFGGDKDRLSSYVISENYTPAYDQIHEAQDKHGLFFVDF